MSIQKPRDPKLSAHLMSHLITIDPKKVWKQGPLLKKGNVFKGFQKKYVYLEDVYLKYGKVNKAIAGCIDLRQAVVIKHPKVKTQFKVKTAKQKLKLRAETECERNDWVAAIVKVVASA